MLTTVPPPPQPPNSNRLNANKRKAEDEFDIFATHIAAQLRLLPLQNALKLQEKIQALVTKERLACVTEHTNKRGKKNEEDMSVYSSADDFSVNVVSPSSSNYHSISAVFNIKEEDPFDPNDSDSV